MLNIINMFLNKLHSGFRSIRNSYYRRLFKKSLNKPNVGCRVSVKGFHFIELGKDVTISDYCRMHAWEKYENEVFSPQIKIGDNVFINSFSYISSCNSVTIGNNVLIGSNVLISDNSHGNLKNILAERDIPPISRPLFSKGPLSIGNNVWIGQNVVITSGVSLGDNCIVAANSVVTKSFPPNVLIGGVPAKIVRNLC